MFHQIVVLQLVKAKISPSKMEVCCHFRNFLASHKAFKNAKRTWFQVIGISPAQNMKMGCSMIYFTIHVPGSSFKQKKWNILEFPCPNCLCSPRPNCPAPSPFRALADRRRAFSSISDRPSSTSRAQLRLWLSMPG